MRTLSLLIAFLGSNLISSIAVAQAAAPLPATPDNAQAPHPIVGQWTWKLPGKACTETLDYRVDGSRASHSGEEAIQGSYDITALPSLLGFYRVVETVTTANAKRDCSGDLHAASDPPITRFIQFNPKRDQFIVCQAESLKACFGPLRNLQNQR
jgi:hypothetical protein